MVCEGFMDLLNDLKPRITGRRKLNVLQHYWWATADTPVFRMAHVQYSDIDQPEAAMVTYDSFTSDDQ